MAQEGTPAISELNPTLEFGCAGGLMSEYGLMATSVISQHQSDAWLDNMIQI